MELEEVTMDQLKAVRKDYLAQVCAAFSEESEEALKKEYPHIATIIPSLKDDSAWSRIGRHEPTEEEMESMPNIDRVFLYEAKLAGHSVNAEIYIFGLGVEGLRITVDGE